MDDESFCLHLYTLWTSSGTRPSRYYTYFQIVYGNHFYKIVQESSIASAARWFLWNRVVFKTWKTSYSFRFSLTRKVKINHDRQLFQFLEHFTRPFLVCWLNLCNLDTTWSRSAAGAEPLSWSTQCQEHLGPWPCVKLPSCRPGVPLGADGAGSASVSVPFCTATFIKTGRVNVPRISVFMRG